MRKNSPARNVHRLMGTLAFISAIFENLAKGQALKDAVSEAYDRTLAALHTWVVRAGIKAGLVALPTREAFFTAIGETGGRGGWAGGLGGGVRACACV